MRLIVKYVHVAGPMGRTQHIISGLVGLSLFLLTPFYVRIPPIWSCLDPMQPCILLLTWSVSLPSLSSGLDHCAADTCWSRMPAHYYFDYVCASTLSSDAHCHRIASYILCCDTCWDACYPCLISRSWGSGHWGCLESLLCFLHCAHPNCLLG